MNFNQDFFIKNKPLYRRQQSFINYVYLSSYDISYIPTYCSFQDGINTHENINQAYSEILKMLNMLLRIGAQITDQEFQAIMSKYLLLIGKIKNVYNEYSKTKQATPLLFLILHEFKHALEKLVFILHGYNKEDVFYKPEPSETEIFFKENLAVWIDAITEEAELKYICEKLLEFNKINNIIFTDWYDCIIDCIYAELRSVFEDVVGNYICNIDKENKEHALLVSHAKCRQKYFGYNIQSDLLDNIDSDIVKRIIKDVEDVLAERIENSNIVALFIINKLKHIIEYEFKELDHVAKIKYINLVLGLNVNSQQEMCLEEEINGHMVLKSNYIDIAIYYFIREFSYSKIFSMRGVFKHYTDEFDLKLCLVSSDISYLNISSTNTDSIFINSSSLMKQENKYIINLLYLSKYCISIICDYLSVVCVNANSLYEAVTVFDIKNSFDPHDKLQILNSFVSNTKNVELTYQIIDLLFDKLEYCPEEVLTLIIENDSVKLLSKLLNKGLNINKLMIDERTFLFYLMSASSSVIDTPKLINYMFSLADLNVFAIDTVTGNNVLFDLAPSNLKYMESLKIQQQDLNLINHDNCSLLGKCLINGSKDFDAAYDVMLNSYIGYGADINLIFEINGESFNMFTYLLHVNKISDYNRYLNKYIKSINQDTYAFLIKSICYKKNLELLVNLLYKGNIDLSFEIEQNNTLLEYLSQVFEHDVIESKIINYIYNNSVYNHDKDCLFVQEVYLKKLILDSNVLMLVMLIHYCGSFILNKIIDMLDDNFKDKILHSIMHPDRNFVLINSFVLEDAAIILIDAVTKDSTPRAEFALKLALQNKSLKLFNAMLKNNTTNKCNDLVNSLTSDSIVLLMSLSMKLKLDDLTMFFIRNMIAKSDSTMHMFMIEKTCAAYASEELITKISNLFNGSICDFSNKTDTDKQHLFKVAFAQENYDCIKLLIKNNIDMNFNILVKRREINILYWLLRIKNITSGHIKILSLLIEENKYVETFFANLSLDDIKNSDIINSLFDSAADYSCIMKKVFESKANINEESKLNYLEAIFVKILNNDNLKTFITFYELFPDIVILNGKYVFSLEFDCKIINYMIDSDLFSAAYKCDFINSINKGCNLYYVICLVKMNLTNLLNLILQEVEDIKSFISNLLFVRIVLTTVDIDFNTLKILFNQQCILDQLCKLSFDIVNMFCFRLIDYKQYDLLLKVINALHLNETLKDNCIYKIIDMLDLYGLQFMIQNKVLNKDEMDKYVTEDQLRNIIESSNNNNDLIDLSRTLNEINNYKPNANKLKNG